jgi:hypothetical protein
MNIRHHRRSALTSATGTTGDRPVRFVLAGGPPPPASERKPEAAQGPLPTAGELTRFVREQLVLLYPNLPREALDGAAGQGARQALAMALVSPQAAAVLPQLAMQAARSIIALYLALTEQDHLRPVA